VINSADRKCARRCEEISEPLSILHVDTGRAFRGGQQALLTLARGLRERGHSQQIATPANSALTERANQDGLTSVPLGSVLDLRRALRGVQIVHAHSGRAQNLAFLAAMRLPVVRVMTRHVAFEPRYPRIHALKYGAGCHGVIAVSEPVRRVLVNAGVPETKIEIIPNGIESPEKETSAEERRAARLTYGIGENDFAVGHLGAFTREKGQDVAMEAFAILRDRMPGLRMILAGDGAPPVAPDARVLLPGFVTNRKEFFAALDLFIMPSRSEGWGLAAAEALAHGIPVVASDMGGLASIVEPGKTGWLVEPGDSRALASAIEEAASDPRRLKEMSSRGREGSARFSTQKTADLTEGFYRRLMERDR